MEGDSLASTALSQISKARQALEAAKTLPDVLDIRDKAAAIKHWAKTSGESLEAMNAAAEVKALAERKAGGMLTGMDKAKNQHGAGNTMLPATYSDLGIDKMQSSRWQRIASIPEKLFRQHLADTIAKGREITSAGLLKLAAQQPRKPKANGKRGNTDDHWGVVQKFEELDGQRFGTIYADPPWQYGNQSTRAATSNHYRTMTVADLCRLPIKDLAADAAHLHLWTTNGFVREAFEVIDAWGFEYRSMFVWVKPQMGIGNYWRVSHELLLLGIRGDSKSFAEHSHKSWGEFPRTKHSKKPEEVRQIIERVSPGPYLELFGRKAAMGWCVFGNQIGESLFK